MIFINNLSVEFTGRKLFDDVTFVINPKDRIGLIGKNGVGKSTLLNIIAGKQQFESGSITTSAGKTIGYLPQSIKNSSDKNIFEEALTAFDVAIQLQKDIDDITHQLETREDYQSDAYGDLINLLTEKQEHLNIIGVGNMEGDVEKILLGLGFKSTDFTRPMSEFSGGWQMRVELAKLLLVKPDLLLLDEPTNHLDIESILWLEDLFKNYHGALMMVSHDKMFLDNITNRTIEIVFGKIYDYKVAYTKYFQLRAERLEQQRAAYNNQQKYIAQQQAFIDRFKAKASKAKQAQSIAKRLEKIEEISFDELDTSSIHFRFPPPPRSGTVVITAKGVHKTYGNNKILDNLNFTIERGEKVAFVGQNGEGKSTLVKLITGNEKFEGEIIPGHNVAIGYYAQIQEKTLDENISVIQTIENDATGDMAKTHMVRALLGAFLFGEEDVNKKVRVLSGGEKSRLALAKMMLTPSNLLILDEPTNHLDIASKEVLKEALQNFTGTLILVSHDRDFLKGLTNRTFEFKNKQIKEHLGDIDEFLSHHHVETFRDFEMTKEIKKQATAPQEVSTNTTSEKKENDKKLKQTKNAIAKTEKEIQELETAIAELDTIMSDPQFYIKNPNADELLAKYANLKENLDKCMSEWEALSTELTTFQS